MSTNLQPISETLSKDEQSKLQHHEANIQIAFDAQDTGLASLAVIRDERLYKSQFHSFEEYCQKRWDITRRRADQKIAFHKLTQKQISNGEPTTSKEPRPKPKTEKHVSQIHQPVIDISSEIQETEKPVSHFDPQSLPPSAYKPSKTQSNPHTPDNFEVFAASKASFDKELAEYFQAILSAYNSNPPPKPHQIHAHIQDMSDRHLTL